MRFLLPLFILLSITAWLRSGAIEAVAVMMGFTFFGYSLLIVYWRWASRRWGVERPDLIAMIVRSVDTDGWSKADRTTEEWLAFVKKISVACMVLGVGVLVAGIFDPQILR